MFEHRCPVQNLENGHKGQLRIAGGIWSGDACVFEFNETVLSIPGEDVARV